MFRRVFLVFFSIMLMSAQHRPRQQLIVLPRSLVH